MTKIFRSDFGKENYDQRNNVINPHNTCSTTSMTMALDYLGYNLPGKELCPEFQQVEDKLTYFCLTNDKVKEFYKETNSSYYNEWIKEFEKQEKEGVDIINMKWIDSYPPNEIHSVLSYAVNQFIGMNATYFKQNSNIKEIVAELVKCKPVVVSVKFGNLNHVLTLTGVEVEILDDGVKPINFFVDDTYGKFDITSNKYISKDGNDCVFKVEELSERMKGIGSSVKWAHFFNEPTAVI